jgi:hypothetical protein
MARTDSTRVKWRIQVRKGKGLVWRNRGLYETRSAARYVATYMRDMHIVDGVVSYGYGFGNTRVIRHIRGEKK